MDSVGLFLIGMGPGGVSNMTEGAIATAKAADHRRYEAYTALWSEEDLSELEEMVGMSYTCACLYLCICIHVHWLPWDPHNDDDVS